MRYLDSSEVTKAVKDLFIRTNHILPNCVGSALAEAKAKESNALAASVLETLEKNIQVAKSLDVPVCQDTGMAIVFAEIGKDLHLTGKTLNEAINEGVHAAYLDGKLRCSVVHDPFFDRTNTGDNTPAITYISFCEGDKLKLTALPKGFGSENMSAIKMFTPSATRADIINFVLDTVKKAGSNPCPPIVVGIGIGGSFDYATVLSKKALARDLDDQNPNEDYRALEEELLRKINELGIGPQGFGGDTTALAVKIEHYPTHIAGLPVAVNICCHVARHLTTIL
ncbi:MAG: fumarate hydratase [Clostridia bacterium]|nr:fumarate hydratase [Clostridia bacterium]